MVEGAPRLQARWPIQGSCGLKSAPRFMAAVTILTSRLGAMNLAESPSSALPAPSPPVVERDRVRGRMGMQPAGAG